jgi:hypothetical protein
MIKKLFIFFTPFVVFVSGEKSCPDIKTPTFPDNFSHNYFLNWRRGEPPTRYGLEVVKRTD